jgi:hypothetical protein
VPPDEPSPHAAIASTDESNHAPEAILDFMGFSSFAF